jgi:hypothetical protein
MEPEVSLPRSLEPATGPYPELYASSPHLPTQKFDNALSIKYAELQDDQSPTRITGLARNKSSLINKME